MKLFGTSGIRGYTSYTGETDYITLSDDFCYNVVKAFIKHLNKKGVIVVGRDLRETSFHIQNIIMQSIFDNGCIPINCGITPTPALTYYVKNSDCIGGIMITGSHIKASMNGLKFINNEEEISKVEEADIERIYDEIKDEVSNKDFSKRDAVSDFCETNNANDCYTNFLKKHAKDYRSLKIVIDVRNSCHKKTMISVLTQAGAEVISLTKEQEKFIALDTESSDAVNTELQQAILKNNADLGITYDSDGDRPSFYDEQGNLITGDMIAIILADNLQTKNIATPINSSSGIDTIGKTIYCTKVGSPYVIAAMKQYNCGFGFESNGGCIFSEIMYTRDGGYPTILLLNLLVLKKKKLSQLIADYPCFFMYKTKIDCSTKYNQYILDTIRKKYLAEKKQMNELDGLKVYLDKETWILFRPSSNAPEFRVFVESRSKDKTQELVTEAISLVKTLLDQAKIYKYN